MHDGFQQRRFCEFEDVANTIAGRCTECGFVAVDGMILTKKQSDCEILNLIPGENAALHAVSNPFFNSGNILVGNRTTRLAIEKREVQNGVVAVVA